MTPYPPSYEEINWLPRNEFILFSKGNPISRKLPDTEGVKVSEVDATAIAIGDNNHEIRVEENSKYKQFTIIVTFMIIVKVTNMRFLLPFHRQCGMLFCRYMETI